jgi:hypothetical protein
VKYLYGCFLNQQNDKSFNEAIFGGVLVFSLVFLTMKDVFSSENKTNFLALIFVYLFASICRIFGIILESEKINTINIHYCRVILIPFSVWATVTILFTEMKYAIPFISYYFFVITEYLVVTKTYGYKFNFRSPIVLERLKKK